MMEFRAKLWMALGLVCLLQLILKSEACNCLVNHPQTKYCFSDFVIQAKVLERKKIVHPDTSRPLMYRYLIGYRVEIESVYKGKDYIGDEPEIWVHTPDAGGLCGVSGLKTEGVYLLSGRYTRDIYYMRYCDMWFDWDDLTPQQMMGVTSIYNNNCNCRIKGVMGIINVADHERDLTKVAYLAKSPLWDDESCRYNPVASLYYKTHDCETHYSHCIYANETCLWEPSPDYLLCYEAREAVWRHRNTLKGLAANRPKPRARCKISATRFVRRCSRAKDRRQQKRRLAQGLMALPRLPSQLNSDVTMMAPVTSSIME